MSPGYDLLWAVVIEHSASDVSHLVDRREQRIRHLLHLREYRRVGSVLRTIIVLVCSRIRPATSYLLSVTPTYGGGMLWMETSTKRTTVTRSPLVLSMGCCWCQHPGTSTSRQDSVVEPLADAGDAPCWCWCWCQHPKTKVETSWEVFSFSSMSFRTATSCQARRTARNIVKRFLVCAGMTSKLTSHWHVFL